MEASFFWRAARNAAIIYEVKAALRAARHIMP